MIWTTSARTFARRWKRPLIGALSLSVAIALLASLGAAPASATDPTFPSWADVLAAEQNATAKKAEIAKISAIVGTLQAQSAAAGKIAEQAGEVYDEAANALDTATATAKKLELQASAAKKKALASSREAGQLAAQLAREGHGNISLNLFLHGSDATDLLDVLGTMGKLSETSARIFATAEENHQTASALGQQANVAEAARAAKAATAKADFAMATDAANAAQAQVNAETSQQTVLTAQLASLNGTTADVEAQYLAGVAWEAQQAAQTAPPADPPPPAQEPGAPSGSAVSAAIAFAQAQIGKPYVIDGAGPNGWDCSGLTMASYAAAGVYIGGHGTNLQWSTLSSENRLVPLSDRQPGDLLWYSDGGSASASKYHVTMYIGNNEMIEAAYPGTNVRITALRYGDLVAYAGRPTG